MLSRNELFLLRNLTDVVLDSIYVFIFDCVCMCARALLRLYFEVSETYFSEKDCMYCMNYTFALPSSCIFLNTYFSLSLKNIVSVGKESISSVGSAFNSAKPIR